MASIEPHVPKQYACRARSESSEPGVLARKSTARDTVKEVAECAAALEKQREASVRSRVPLIESERPVGRKQIVP